MSSIALFAVGSAVNPIVGALLGGIGAFIDQRFIMPTVFGKPQSLDQAKLDSKLLDRYSEGSPLNRVLGKKNRIAGTWIFVGDLIEVPSDGGGKGGGAPAGPNDYYRDCALALAHPLHSITEVYAEEKKIATIAPDVEFTGAMSIEVEAMGVTFKGGTLYEVHSFRVLLVFPDHDTRDLFNVKRVITMSGWSNAVNNKDHLFDKLTSVNPKMYREYQFGSDSSDGEPGILVDWSGAPGDWDGIAAAAAEQEGIAAVESAGSIDVSQAGTEYDQSMFLAGDPGTVPIQFYNGSEDQDVDEYLNEVSDIEQPAYRGTAYIVLRGLALGRSGNRLPNVTCVVSQTASDMPLATAFTTILDDHGYDASEYDVSEVTGTLDGYVISGPNSGVAKTEPLLIAYDITVHESIDGKLIFRDRSAIKTLSVAARDLAHHQEGSDPAAPLTITDPAPTAFPLEVNVDYVEESNDYQIGSQGFRVPTADVTNFPGGPVQRVEQVNFPLTLTASQAQTIARRLAYDPRRTRHRAMLTLPPSYYHVENNDHLELETGQTVRVFKRDEGANGLIEIEGVLEDATYLDYSSIADEPDNPDVPIYTPPLLILAMPDPAPLLEEHILTPGYYFALAATDPDAAFIGASIFESTNDNDYAVAHNVQAEAAIGITTDDLGAPAAHGYWDRGNSVTVELFHGSLESRSASQVLDGKNRMFIGGELIGFRYAELIDTRTYRLHTLLRGLRNTERFMDHVGENDEPAGGEVALLLSTANVGFQSISTGSIGATRYYKPVAAGMPIELVTPTTITFQGNTLRPFTPVHVRFHYDADGSLNVTWIRRTRTLARLFQSKPLIESVEAYELEFLDATTGDVLRTIETTATNATYTPAQQIADGLAVGEQVEGRVYQRGDFIDRSFPATFIAGTPTT